MLKDWAVLITFSFCCMCFCYFCFVSFFSGVKTKRQLVEPLKDVLSEGIAVIQFNFK